MAIEKRVSRRGFVSVAVTAVVVGVVAGVGGYYAGLISAPPGAGVTTTITGPERTTTITTTARPVTTTSTVPGPERTVTSTTTVSAQRKWKIALLSISPKDDYGWGMSMTTKSKEAIEEDYPNLVEVSMTDVIPYPETAKAVRDYAQLGFDFIIADEPTAYGAELDKIAPEFPEIRFASIMESDLKAANLSSYNLLMEPGNYLIGIVGGLMTKTNKIGLITGEVFPGPVSQAGSAYNAAHSVNPDVTVKTVFVGSWIDPVKCKEAALAMIKSDIDFIYTYADLGDFGTAEAIREMKAQGYPCYIAGVGVDAADAWDLPDLYTTTYLYNHPWLVMQAMKDFISGRYGNEVKTWDMKALVEAGGQPLGKYHPAIPTDVIKKVEEVKWKIIRGEIETPRIEDPELVTD